MFYHCKHVLITSDIKLVCGQSNIIKLLHYIHVVNSYGQFDKYNLIIHPN